MLTKMNKKIVKVWKLKILKKETNYPEIWCIGCCQKKIGLDPRSSFRETWVYGHRTTDARATTILKVLFLKKWRFGDIADACTRYLSRNFGLDPHTFWEVQANWSNTGFWKFSRVSEKHVQVNRSMKCSEKPRVNGRERDWGSGISHSDQPSTGIRIRLWFTTMEIPSRSTNYFVWYGTESHNN